MLTITNLSADYGGKPAPENINLTLESGELLVVLGPSGCGKTTLLNLIAGFVPYQHGSIQLEGKKWKARALSAGGLQNEGLLPAQRAGKCGVWVATGGRKPRATAGNSTGHAQKGRS